MGEVVHFMVKFWEQISFKYSWKQHVFDLVNVWSVIIANSLSTLGSESCGYEKHMYQTHIANASSKQIVQMLFFSRNI